MSAARANPALKALQYAERDLGVHAVYEGARTTRDNLDSVFTELAGLKDARRLQEASIQEREMAIVADERGKHPDQSAAWMERHLKLAFGTDPELIGHRHNLSQILGDIEGREYDARIQEIDLKVAIARMNELGGYLNYLSVVKASVGRSTTTPSEESQH